MTKFPKSQLGLEELRNYVIADPWPFMIDLSQSQGMYLATPEGEHIFDWAGYYGSKLIAHNHPKMLEPLFQKKIGLAAINKMANPDFLTQECLDYYAMLYKLAPKIMRNDRLEVYAVNSGAEAVENMLKYLLNRHHRKLEAAGKRAKSHRFLYFDESFHGRTVYALGITELSHDDVMVKDTRGIYQNNIKIPFPEYIAGDSQGNTRRVEQSLSFIQNLLSMQGDSIVAIIAEPIQGAGGQRCAPDGFFAKLSQLCNDYQIDMGFDEVQTAGGQTGEIFMVDQLGLPYPPSAVASGKKFGNGIVYMIESMDDIGVLDSTWGGTLADMVRVVREFQIVEEEDLIAQVPEKGGHLSRVLNQLCEKYPDLISNVRGEGLYLGFSLNTPEHKGRLITIALEQENTLLLGAGANAIRMRPHLNVTLDDITELGIRLDRALNTLRSTASES